MSEPAEIVWDQSAFNKALDAYVAASPHELSEILNKKMGFIIMNARKHTPVADRSKIEAQFGISYETKVSKKTGKVRRKLIAANAPSVGLIIWQLRMQGKPIPSNQTLQRMARTLPGKRLRAVGSLRMGWTRAVRAFLRGQAGDTFGPRVKSPGKAKMATPGFDPVAEAQFDLAIRSHDEPEMHQDPRVVAALRFAFATEAASMNDYVIKKMQERADRINAK